MPVLCYLKVDRNEKMRGLCMETEIGLQPGTVAIKGYFKFEHVVFL